MDCSQIAKYCYSCLFLLNLVACKSMQLCEETLQKLQQDLDKTYWRVEKVSPRAIEISSNQDFELGYYFIISGFRPIEKSESYTIEGFTYRAFESPYRIGLTFRTRHFDLNKHILRERRIRFQDWKQNPKSTLQPRVRYVYQSIPIVLTTQFDDNGCIQCTEYLDSTTQSAIQLDHLIGVVNQYFNEPKELGHWSQKKDFRILPSEYKNGIQRGIYRVDSVGGIRPDWDIRLIR